jgi:hypothetical protein
MTHHKTSLIFSYESLVHSCFYPGFYADIGNSWVWPARLEVCQWRRKTLA